MVAPPALMPVTIPVDDPTLATDRLLLLQTPPPVVLINKAGTPIQIAGTPAITTGDRFTVIVCVTKQPPGSV